MSHLTQKPKNFFVLLTLVAKWESLLTLFSDDSNDEVELKETKNVENLKQKSKKRYLFTYL